MPFGLDLKSLIIGIVFALVVWPRVLGLLGNVGSSAPQA